MKTKSFWLNTTSNVRLLAGNDIIVARDRFGRNDSRAVDIVRDIAARHSAPKLQIQTGRERDPQGQFSHASIRTPLDSGTRTSTCPILLTVTEALSGASRQWLCRTLHIG